MHEGHQRAYPDRSCCLQGSCPTLPTPHAHLAKRGTLESWDTQACCWHMEKMRGRLLPLFLSFQGNPR